MRRPVYRKTEVKNTYETEMDKALQNDPPEIQWRKNRHGVFEAVEVRDPHGETSIQAQAERLRASADRAERAEREEAYAVAERFRKFRAENTRLMAAARTSI